MISYDGTPELTLTDARMMIRDGKIRSVSFTSAGAKFELNDGGRFVVEVTSEAAGMELMADIKKANDANPHRKIEFKNPDMRFSFYSWVFILNGLPVLIGIAIVGLLIVLVRKKSFK